MRVMIINTLYPPSRIGGAEKSVGILAEALARAGHDVMAVSLHPGRERIDERIDGVRVVRLPNANIYWQFDGQERPAWKRLAWHVVDIVNPRAIARVMALVRDFAPDVVHTNNIQGFSGRLLGALTRRKLPVVHTLRDYSLMCSRAALYRNGRQCITRCRDCVALTLDKKRQSQRVTAVVSNSQYVIDRHVTDGYFDSVASRSVTFNIADFTQPVAAETPEDVLVFGFIGRVEPEKGIEVVLAATALMTEPAWQLRIAGLGDEAYVGRLRTRYDDPRITWLGHSSADAFYRSIDTTLIASTWPEPLPRTLIESLAYGRSTICARTGGIPEIALHDDRAVLYDAEDAPALARLLDEAVRDRVARKRASRPDDALFARFSEESVVGRYVATYEAAIAARTAA